MSYHPIQGGLQDDEDPDHSITLDAADWEGDGPTWREHASTPIALPEVLQRLHPGSLEGDHALHLHRARIEEGMERLKHATPYADEETLAHIALSIDRLVEERMRAEDPEG